MQQIQPLNWAFTWVKRAQDLDNWMMVVFCGLPQIKGQKHQGLQLVVIGGGLGF